MARILVTGSEGSLMQAVIPKLKSAGHEVYGVDSLERYGERRYIAEANYPFLRGDLTDPFFVDDVFDQSQPDYVIQAAAKIYGVGGFHAHPAEILGDDVLLQTNLLKKAQEFGTLKKFIYISSSMVYETTQTHPSAEGIEELYCVPKTDYGLSKLVGERLVKAFSNQYGMNYTIWRPFNIITPHEPTEQDLGVSHVFADFIGNIIQKKLNPLPIIGDGSQVRCFTWIDDVAEAIANYSFLGETNKETYNIGNPEPISMSELAGLIYKQANEKGLIDNKEPLAFQTQMSYNDDVHMRIPDIQKISSLGWKPTHTVSESVSECLNHLVKISSLSKAGIISVNAAGGNGA